MTSPLRALVVGTTGNLGRMLQDVLNDEGGLTLLPGIAGRADCDIRDRSALLDRLRDGKPDLLFNTAAYTQVDGAESDPDTAFAINSDGAATVASVCAQVGIRMIHYSTDFVFDGEDEQPYAEDAVPRPLSVYGRSKALGDAKVMEFANTLVLRVGCLFGEGGRNFPSTMARRLLAGETLRCDDTRLASPTWTRRAAQISIAAAKTAHTGMFHLTSHGSVSWAGFARFLAGHLNLPANRILALPSDALALPAARPRRAVLAKDRLAACGLDTLGTWQQNALAYLASQSPPLAPT